MDLSLVKPLLAGPQSFLGNASLTESELRVLENRLREIRHDDVMSLNTMDVINDLTIELEERSEETTKRRSTGNRLVNSNWPSVDTRILLWHTHCYKPTAEVSDHALLVQISKITLPWIVGEKLKRGHMNSAQIALLTRSSCLLRPLNVKYIEPGAATKYPASGEGYLRSGFRSLTCTIDLAESWTVPITREECGAVDVVLELQICNQQWQTSHAFQIISKSDVQLFLDDLGKSRFSNGGKYSADLSSVEHGDTGKLHMSCFFVSKTDAENEQKTKFSAMNASGAKSGRDIFQTDSSPQEVGSVDSLCTSSGGGGLLSKFLSSGRRRRKRRSRFPRGLRLCQSDWLDQMPEGLSAVDSFIDGTGAGEDIYVWSAGLWKKNVFTNQFSLMVKLK